MPKDTFLSRHVGPRDVEIKEMLEVIGEPSLDALINKVIPQKIQLKEQIKLQEPLTEYGLLKKIKKIASKNKIFKSYIGSGYYGTITPSVILRNILENPSWYTSYTPYQAEISQGRLEALLNFQTAIIDLTKMDIANASLLDEATAAAEAMIMFYNKRTREAIKNEANVFFVDKNIFPQTIEVLKGKASAWNIELFIEDINNYKENSKIFGAIVQYPCADGKIVDYTNFANKLHSQAAYFAVVADILSLALLTPPGEFGADVVCGSTQRLGIPMGFGGPHAAYFACKDEFKRNIPGRIIGISVDKNGNKAYRMALQTREQHIKREKATSNICTAQALLATMAGMYAVYHGKEGLQNIAKNINILTFNLAENLEKLGYKLENNIFFDTIKINIPQNISIESIKKQAEEEEINFHYTNNNQILISIDETISLCSINRILGIFAKAINKDFAKLTELDKKSNIDNKFIRKDDFLKADVFNKYRSETEMMRYIKKLERKDFSLTHCMISLGSCTMKLNAATEMLPITWAEFNNIHPFAPDNQIDGYKELISELENDLCSITGFSAVSLQPNSGAQGEYAGLMVIKKYHESKNQQHRNIVLIPASAHGTNPASAVMAGLKVVVVACDEKGNIDLLDLKAKAEQNKENLCAFMVTYPSTHGVFEEEILEMNEIIHQNGGLVYMDGANMNAQVGITNPNAINADVCHLNLHKTFAIPHGGGGPGVGPIAVNDKLKDFLPSHTEKKVGGSKGIHSVAAAPYGSASVLPISFAYIKMLGEAGLKYSTKIAILNANYISKSLEKYFKTLYTGKNGYVAHEMILDCRPFKQLADISETDIAKRLMDYGFHAPTLSFPVHGTLMVEPTESESKVELDKFIAAMIDIYKDIMEIKDGKVDKVSNVLRNAPHTEQVVTSNKWENKYEREKAAYPLDWVRENKFWPAISRIDDAFGDRNLMCSCQ